MLRVTYSHSNRIQEVPVDGSRDDYANLSDAVRQVLTSGSEEALPVQSAGQTNISCLVVRQGPPPNRVSCERDCIVFRVAPNLQEQFLSQIRLPSDAHLLRLSIRRGYHHHFDHAGDERYIAPDSLPVVFGLE